ncbi:MAG: hypothetical protein EOP62_23065 [Sphingomonadales bacterium]|nr:MAG: hypothetical protein EOP62_23065 [Sphingomonadales bacterium]
MRAGRYAVGGLQQGVASAFLGDTLASAFSGSPLLSSLYSAANADVAGGPYAIEIGRGSLTSDAGYDFAFDSAGRLSIARKAVTANVAVDNKTYDGPRRRRAALPARMTSWRATMSRSLAAATPLPTRMSTRTFAHVAMPVPTAAGIYTPRISPGASGASSRAR